MHRPRTTNKNTAHLGVLIFEGIHPSAGLINILDCFWVGSLDFRFLGNQFFFPLNPQVIHSLQRGCKTDRKPKPIVGVPPF